MRYRNCSAIYYFSGQGAILMDCAEGTYGQIMDYLGDKHKVDQTVLKTQLLFVSHLHGDHVLGVPKFL